MEPSAFDRTRFLADDRAEQVAERAQLYAELFDLAADLLEQTGWCQGKFALDRHGKGTLPGSDDACRFCLMGALLRANRLLGLTVRGLLDPVNSWINDPGLYRYLLVGTSIGLANWNDAAGRTKAEVVAELRLASHRAHKQASRDDDQARLNAGEVTPEQLRAENSFFDLSGGVTVDLKKGDG